MARNACKKAIPSRPWESAKDHREGFWIRDQEIWLFVWGGLDRFFLLFMRVMGKGGKEGRRES